MPPVSSDFALVFKLILEVRSGKQSNYKLSEYGLAAVMERFYTHSAVLPQLAIVFRRNELLGHTRRLMFGPDWRVPYVREGALKSNTRE